MEVRDAPARARLLPGGAHRGPGQGTGQLAATLLLDHTGNQELTAEEAYWFTRVLERIDTLRWEMSPAWIDQWLAEQQRRRESGRLRCHGDAARSDLVAAAFRQTLSGMMNIPGLSV